MARGRKGAKAKTRKAKAKNGNGNKQNAEEQKPAEDVPEAELDENRVSEDTTSIRDEPEDGGTKYRAVACKPEDVELGGGGPGDYNPRDSEIQGTEYEGGKCDANNINKSESSQSKGRKPKSRKAGEGASKGVVAIIGYSSFLGYTIAHSAMLSGYHVRIIMGQLNQEQFSQFLHSFIRDNLNRVSTRAITNPDKEQLTRAFKGVDYIIYTASPPLANSKHPVDASLEFNVHCMWDIIQAAKQHKRIRRIIVTSSITAYFKSEELDDYNSTKLIQGENTPVHVDHCIDPTRSPPHSSADYAGSRGADLILAEMCDRAMPGIRFDFVHLLATNVFGCGPPCWTATSFNTGSNSRLLNHILGKGEGRLITTSVHIDDVARCHIEALSKKKVPSGRYILTGGYTNWLDAISIAKKYFPALVGSEIAKEDILKRIKRCKINNARTKEIFG
ncbi:hypothetical protein GGR51DRAFT_557242 [Nemania sp. FL0031]|nr:hypothetical protein GGR51DRAFT_557242 [Nemania sp. FL0031]